MKSENLISLARIANLVTSVAKGLERKEVSVAGRSVSYLEAGSGETLLFIHGFAGTNYMWRSWLQQLKTHYHVIAVTIPELEPTLDFAKAHYSFRTYSEWINQFLKEVNIEKCHLLAHCTGGCIAAFFASSYTEKVASLTLFSPPNIGQLAPSITLNTFEKAQELDLTDSEQLKKLVSDSFYNAPSIPMLMTNQLKKVIDSRQLDINFMLLQLSEASRILLRRLPLISAPTLLIGGCDDKFLSNAETLRYFQQQIDGSQLELLEHCGHFPFQEQKETSLNLFNDFITTITTTKQIAS